MDTTWNRYALTGRLSVCYHCIKCTVPTDQGLLFRSQCSPCLPLQKCLYGMGGYVIAIYCRVIVANLWILYTPLNTKLHLADTPLPEVRVLPAICDPFYAKTNRTVLASPSHTQLGRLQTPIRLVELLLFVTVVNVIEWGTALTTEMCGVGIAGERWGFDPLSSCLQPLVLFIRLSWG